MEFLKDIALPQPAEHVHLLLFMLNLVFIVLLPYFDASGAFRVAVMERNLQTSISSLVRRYGAEYVHLVRIDPRGAFDPPAIPVAR